MTQTRMDHMVIEIELQTKVEGVEETKPSTSLESKIQITEEAIQCLWQGL